MHRPRRCCHSDEIDQSRMIGNGSALHKPGSCSRRRPQLIIGKIFHTPHQYHSFKPLPGSNAARYRCEHRHKKPKGLAKSAPERVGNSSSRSALRLISLDCVGLRGECWIPVPLAPPIEDSLLTPSKLVAGEVAYSMTLSPAFSSGARRVPPHFRR